MRTLEISELELVAGGPPQNPPYPTGPTSPSGERKKWREWEERTGGMEETSDGKWVEDL